MHIGPAPQLMDFFDHPGTAPPPRGEFFARLFFVGVGWFAMDTGLRRYDEGWEWSDAGMTEFWVIIMFYKMC